VTSASVLWERREGGTGWRVAVGCTHPNETVSLVHLSLLQDLYTDEAVKVEVVGMDVWPTDGLGKGINIWISPSLTQGSSAPGMCVVDVLVAGVRGVCRLWSLLLTESVPSAAPRHVCDMLSARGDIVTAALLFRERERHQEGTGRACAVLGDCRGNVSVAFLPLLSPLPLNPLEGSDNAMIVPAKLCVARAHGNEVVSCLSKLASGQASSFCSLGHDGYMNVYDLTTNCAGSDVVEVASRLSCLPINAPDLIVAMGEGSSKLSLYVGGYEASDYVVWDVHRKYQLLRIDAGGWKRPHCAVVHPAGTSRFPKAQGVTDVFPAVTFAYLAPWDKGTVFKCIGCSSATVRDSAALPLQLGNPGHGKVAYCGALIPTAHCSSRGECLLAVGAEDGTVKLFRTPTGRVQGAAGEGGESGCVGLCGTAAGGLTEFVQEVHMPSHSSVRAIAHSSSPSSDGGGIIVCGGE
jgi:hypothetical protein